MAKMTIQERVVRYLKEQGYEETVSRSKYRTFIHPSSQNLVFVGKNGAVRKGTCASKSFSITDGFHARMRGWEEKQ